jgi:hypothetical protein
VEREELGSLYFPFNFFFFLSHFKFFILIFVDTLCGLNSIDFYDNGVSLNLLKLRFLCVDFSGVWFFTA